MAKRKLLEFLINNRDFISKQKITEITGVSVKKLDLLVDELKKQEYEISIHPHLGYKLKNIPDNLDLALVKAGLKTKIIGKKLYIFEEVDSTNDKISKLAKDNRFLKEGTVVISQRQVCGRGKYDRKWVSPKGGLYFSVLLKPGLDFTHITIFSLIGALAVAETLDESFNINVSIKWPNDVYIDEKKVCGVLAEIKQIKKSKQILILGVGININSGLDTLPAQSISLKAHIGKKVNKIFILWDILKRIELYYLLYKKKEFGRILKKWKSYSFMLGHQVEVIEGDNILEGYVVNIEPSNGNLVIRLDNGLQKVLTGGCIKILK